MILVTYEQHYLGTYLHNISSPVNFVVPNDNTDREYPIVSRLISMVCLHTAPLSCAMGHGFKYRAPGFGDHSRAVDNTAWKKKF